LRGTTDHGIVMITVCGVIVWLMLKNRRRKRKQTGTHKTNKNNKNTQNDISVRIEKVKI
jgi:uncharacterized membrane protein affecting hemolysin expression